MEPTFDFQNMQHAQIAAVLCFEYILRFWLIQMSLARRLRLNGREATTAMVLGVVAGVIASFAERTDAIITGGNATPLGFVNTYTWLLISATLFGPVGATITTEVQALLGLITAANPLSWLWPIINLVFAVVVGVTSIALSKLTATIGIRARLTVLSVICAVLDIPLTYVVMVTVLALPFAFYLAALPIYIVLQLVPSTIIAYIVLKAVIRSGLISHAER